MIYSNNSASASVRYHHMGRFKLIVVICCVFAFIGLCLPAFSSTDSVSSIDSRSLGSYGFPGLQKTISVDFRGMDIVNVLKFLAIEGDLNIVASKDVVGPVNLLINDVTIGDALEIILSTNNLAYLIKGNIIQIIPNQEYKTLRGVNFYDERQTKIYELKYASANNLGTMLGNIKSEIGKIIFDDSTGMLVVMDTPQKIEEMETIIEKSDLTTVTRVLPTVTRVFELQYAKAEELGPEISKALTSDIGLIRLDKRTNIVIVTDLPHQMQRIEQLITAFDRKTREVFIEAKIVQVTLSDVYKWGVDWDKLFQDAFGKTGLNVTPEVNMPLNLSTFGKLSIARTAANIDLVLEALSTVGETKILSNPHIATEEGKSATINVVTRQPYSETTTTTTEAATTEATEFTFVDVGVKLEVTPVINADGYISILVKPEVSSITGFFPSTTSDQRVPVIETSNAESTVLVKDGTTIIIAGMIKDSKSKSRNKVPLLGDIPLMGKLFSNVSDEIQRTETIVFLTPHIISGEDPYFLERNQAKEIQGLRK